MALRSIALALVLSVSLAAGPPVDGTATGPETKPGQTITLRPRFAPGRYVLTQTMQHQQEVLADGVRRPTQRVSQTIVSTHEIAPPDAAGRQKRLVAFGPIRQHIEIGGRAISYDSEGPAGDQDPNLAAVFEALKAVQFAVTIGPDGKAQNGGELDETWRQLAALAPTLERLLPHLKNALTDAIFKGLPARAAQLLPAGPVAVAEQWQATVTFEMPFGGEVSYVQNCKLKEVQITAAGRLAVIEFSGTFESDKVFPAELRGSRLKITKTKFTETGQMQVNADLGMAVYEKVHQEGEMELSIMERPGQVTEMRLKQKLDRQETLRPDQQPQTAPASSPTGH